MGMNIGIRVTHTGQRPKGSLVDECRAFLHARFPQATDAFGVRVDLRTEKQGFCETDYYTFDLRMFGYAREFGAAGYEVDQVYPALAEFILGTFSFYEDTLTLEPYYSG